MVDKYISVKSKSGRRKVVFHTQEDCDYLNRSKNYRPVSDEEIEWHGGEKCKKCKQMEDDSEA